MYRGFNLFLKPQSGVKSFYNEGIKLYEPYNSEMKKALEDFIRPDGSINASKMQEDWFPEIDADVFISHSHRDEGMAIGLAGYLGETFGIKCFIDSCVWRYADNLIKVIDNRFCKNIDGYTYNYDKRNLSTSHVHMMLSTALIKMIDRCECLLFLNTPHSIKVHDIIDGDETNSPWLYSEIAISRLIRQKEPDAHRKVFIKKALHEEYREEQMTFGYNLNLSHLVDLNESDLVEWEEEYKSHYRRYALDTLYILQEVEDKVTGRYFEK